MDLTGLNIQNAIKLVSKIHNIRFGNENDRGTIIWKGKFIFPKIVFKISKTQGNKTQKL